MSDPPLREMGPKGAVGTLGKGARMVRATRCGKRCRKLWRFISFGNLANENAMSIV